jgi:hypothetical protein
MSFKHAAEPWFAQDVEEMVLTTLTLGLDPWFMGAAPAELNTYFWPARASGDVTVLSSCSGVPVTQWAYEACLDAFARLARDGNPRRAVRLFCRLRRWVIQGIRDAIKIPAAFAGGGLSAGGVSSMARGELQPDDGDFALLRCQDGSDPAGGVRLSD